jgi:iron complex outermembrane receptor protein
MMIRKMFVICCLIHSVYLYGQISGRVTDEKGVPLPGVTIFNPDHEVGTATDADGKFTISFAHDHQMLLEISYLGYNTRKIKVPYSRTPVYIGTVALDPDAKLLEAVIVLDQSGKSQISAPVTRLESDYFERQQQTSFTALLQKIPGIHMINVGTGITKPVIRGMSGQRIIVAYQDIKQESQQWGTDHGLEVDAFEVAEVDILKGPASLQFGSDALGGAIMIRPVQPPEKDSVYGNLAAVYRSNNTHLGTSASISARRKRLYTTARYTYQNFGDFIIPADKFEYNGFTLPIDQNQLRNTAGREENMQWSLGYLSEQSSTRMTYSRYSMRAGIFSGAVGIPRSYNTSDDGNSRNIERPSQHVVHQRFILNQNLYFGPDVFTFNLGVQDNRRQEFSFPEYHLIPPGSNAQQSDLAIGLRLRTYSGNAWYSLNRKTLKYVFGADVQWQQNRRDGFEFLLPDFESWRSGVYTLATIQKSRKLSWTAGFRLDAGHNLTAYSRQFIWNSNQQIIDSLVSPAIDRLFYNWSAGAGFRFDHGNHVLKGNLTKSFRIPHPSETSSNGIHHGTFRHEKGNASLTSEYGIQSDLLYLYEKQHLRAEAAVFAQYYQNFIYLGPSSPAVFSTLPEAGQLFEYRQDNTFFTGFELAVTYQWHKNWSVRQTTDFVQTYNFTTATALPFTPQPRMNTALIRRVNTFWILDDLQFELEHQYFFKAESSWRRDRTEKATPATHMIHASVSFEMPFYERNILLVFGIQNMTNAYFLNHLSRYRWINLPEQGRNISFSLRIPF